MQSKTGELVTKVAKGKPLHCVEMNTGDGLTGTLNITDDDIYVDIYSFSEFFHIDEEVPLYLVAQTGQVVSFHSNVNGGEGHAHYYGRATYHQRLIANVALVGADRWTERDRVKRVTFTVEYTTGLLQHRDKIKAIGRSKFPKREHFSIFEVFVDRMTLKARYGASYGMDFDAPKELWPIFEIEFDEPQGIHDYIQHVSRYVDFLSFCLGVGLKPTNIHIDRLSDEEIDAAIKADSYRGAYEVHYVWKGPEIESRDLHVGGSPVRAWDETELGAMGACLIAWMDRAPAWKRSYILMRKSFALKNVISAERLISACRWLEEIPTASAENALSADDIDAIVGAATEIAKERGHAPAIRERITNALRRVKAETAEERFTRLVATIEGAFGKGILPGDAVAHLKKANYFRGRSAHGHFNPDSEEQFRAFHKSIRAMEAVCYLLNAVDLPIPKEGIARLRSNPLIRDYHYAYE